MVDDNTAKLAICCAPCPLGGLDCTLTAAHEGKHQGPISELWPQSRLDAGEGWFYWPRKGETTFPIVEGEKHNCCPYPDAGKIEDYRNNEVWTCPCGQQYVKDRPIRWRAPWRPNWTAPDGHWRPVSESKHQYKKRPGLSIKVVDAWWSFHRG